MKNIKKVICSILFLSCFSLIGCGENDITEIGSNNRATNATYTTEGKETKLVGDEAATGELVVSYAIGKDDTMVAASIFEELYPNVKLKLETIGTESFSDYSTRLSASIMAGTGPDLFWISSGFDMNKMMRSGTFSDMFEFFENDEYFNIDDYNKGAFCSGQPKGKQFIIPIRYSIPLVMTTKSIATKSEFNALKCTDYLSFIKEAEKAFLKVNNTDKQIGFFEKPYILTLFPQYSGFDWIDYDNYKTDVDTEEFKEVFQFIKKYFEEEMNEGSYSFENYYSSVLALKNNKKAFADFSMVGGSKAFEAMRFLCYYNEEPIQLAWRNANGGINASSVECVAVRSNSSNKRNAYNFIKILLSPKIQNRDNFHSFTIPISNVAMDNIVQEHKKEIEIFYGGETGAIILPALSQKYINEYLVMLSEVDFMEYYGRSDKLFKDAMLPYFKDEKSYDECIKNAQEALEIYVSE